MVVALSGRVACQGLKPDFPVEESLLSAQGSTTMESGGNSDWKGGVMVLAVGKSNCSYSFLDLSLARFSQSTIAIDLL